MDVDKVVLLPIPPTTDAALVQAEVAVNRLITITSEHRDTTGEVLTWLATEFVIETPGQKLEAFGTLDRDAFIAEVRKRRSAGANTFTPREVSALRTTHAEYTPRLHELELEAAGLERRLDELVNEAYGLTPEEVKLMWETAPPRMPVAAREPDANIRAS